MDNTSYFRTVDGVAYVAGAYIQGLINGADPENVYSTGRWLKNNLARIGESSSLMKSLPFRRSGPSSRLSVIQFLPLDAANRMLEQRGLAALTEDNFKASSEATAAPVSGQTAKETYSITPKGKTFCKAVEAVFGDDEPNQPETPVEDAPDYKEMYLELAKKAERAIAFCNAVGATEDCINIGTLATILQQNGADMNERKLFKWFREQGLIRDSADGYEKNIPTEKAVVNGLMRVREVTVNASGANPHISFTPKVTGKGQIYVTEMILGGEAGNV